jgi:hypothetical protein
VPATLLASASMSFESDYLDELGDEYGSVPGDLVD